MRNEECELLTKNPTNQTKISLKLEQKPQSFKMEKMEQSPVLGLLLRPINLELLMCDAGQRQRRKPKPTSPPHTCLHICALQESV